MVSKKGHACEIIKYTRGPLRLGPGRALTSVKLAIQLNLVFVGEWPARHQGEGGRGLRVDLLRGQTETKKDLLEWKEKRGGRQKDMKCET